MVFSSINRKSVWDRYLGQKTVDDTEIKKDWEKWLKTRDATILGKRLLGPYALEYEEFIKCFFRSEKFTKYQNFEVVTDFMKDCIKEVGFKKNHIERFYIDLRRPQDFPGKAFQLIRKFMG